MRESRGVYVESSCKNCELNFGEVCAGNGIMPDGTDTYGKSIEETLAVFDSGCDDWSVSFDEFCKWKDNPQKKYETAVKLYRNLIEYSKVNRITSLSRLEEAVKNDEHMSHEEKRMYLKRLRTITPEARKVFRGQGIAE